MNEKENTPLGKDLETGKTWSAPTIKNMTDVSETAYGGFSGGDAYTAAAS
jgi:hypothetical protein